MYVTTEGGAVLHEFQKFCSRSENHKIQKSKIHISTY